jgi:biotin operon repressor
MVGLVGPLNGMVEVDEETRRALKLIELSLDKRVTQTFWFSFRTAVQLRPGPPFLGGTMAQPRHRTTEVLEMLKQAGDKGMSIMAIANKCGVSEKTANTFIAHLKEEGHRITSFKGREGFLHFLDSEGKIAHSMGIR